MNFYSIAWAPEDESEILIENERYSLNISNVLSVLASEDAETMHRNDSFQAISIGAALSNQELISHDQARIKFYAWLRGAAAAGWRPALYDSDPRLSGKARFDYALNKDKTIGLDGEYLPSLEEWMSIKNSTHWLLYANRVFLDLSFQRDYGRLDLTKPGSYFLLFNFTTELEYFRSYAGPNHRKEWKKFMPAARVEAHKIRAMSESDLRAKGISINESYQDPVPPI